MISDIKRIGAAMIAAIYDMPPARPRFAAPAPVEMSPEKAKRRAKAKAARKARKITKRGRA